MQAYLAELSQLSAASLPASPAVRSEVTARLQAEGAGTEALWHWHVCGVRKEAQGTDKEGGVAHGFTCGVWQIFHFLSVAGSKQEPAAADTVGTAHTAALAASAAQTEAAVHDIVDLAFACSVCRQNFLDEFKSCAFRRCSAATYASSSVDPFVRLQLWMYRLHNGVSTRLFDELQAGPPEQRPQVRGWSVCLSVWCSSFPSFPVSHSLSLTHTHPPHALPLLSSPTGAVAGRAVSQVQRE